MAFSYAVFSTCVSGQWQFAVGDPNFLGWGITVVYALAAASAAIVLWRAPFEPLYFRQGQVLWGMIVLLMAVLALNKQLDLQSLMTTAGRCLAQEQGWYESRRMVQRDFILVLITATILTGAAMVWMLRGTGHRTILPLLGLSALAVFIVMRAGHLLHFFVPDHAAADLLLHGLTSLLEILCPSLLIAGAWKLLRPITRQSLA